MVYVVVGLLKKNNFVLFGVYKSKNKAIFQVELLKQSRAGYEFTFEIRPIHFTE